MPRKIPFFYCNYGHFIYYRQNSFENYVDIIFIGRKVF